LIALKSGVGRFRLMANVLALSSNSPVGECSSRTRPGVRTVSRHSPSWTIESGLARGWWVVESMAEDMMSVSNWNNGIRYIVWDDG
jgi:hypothetical protein